MPNNPNNLEEIQDNHAQKLVEKREEISLSEDKLESMAPRLKSKRNS